ncbi:DUF4394 domain-containing protein [Lacipirellula sp.]|uniref:DUF4394 domain-containing protein n=1 Tax=Lacipirellula sp. TaxID=2691419 RepID=UPI003D0DD18A
MQQTFKCFLLFLAFAFASSVGSAESLYGISSFVAGSPQQLYTIDTATSVVTSSVAIQAPIGSTTFALRSIDVRPSTGQLYGIGFNDNQLYTVNTASGVLTAIGSPLPVSGAIDFNPTVDLIRLIGRSTPNTSYRVNPTTGAVVMLDGQPTFAAGDANDGDIADIRTVAYTNSVTGAVSTTLYDIDVSNDILATQNPANAGTLQTVGSVGVNLANGFLGSGFTGFDISGATGVAYLTDALPGQLSGLYTVNLTTGLASFQGNISGLVGQGVIADIAAIGSAVPEPATLCLALACGMATVGIKRRR